MGFKKLLIIAFVLCIGKCHAETISITADTTRYDKYRDVLIAKGNVIVKGPDFRIESPYVIRYFKEDKITAMDKFVFEKEGYRISGSALEYYYLKDNGDADHVRINFGETFLGGRYMTMDTDKFQIYDGYFTGCNQPQSHYHVSAQQTTLYPDTGLIVAYYATTWVWVAPVIPVPTFVYSAPVPKSKFLQPKQASRAKKLSPEGEHLKEEVHVQQPVPELGANVVDGTFIKQGLNWYFTPRSYLKTSIGYAGKTHFGGSVAANYILNDMSEGELRLGSNEMEGASWGWTHFLSFGQKLITKYDEDALIYEYYKPGGRYSYELEVLTSNRERPHHELNEGPFTRVSYTSKATIRSNRKPLPLLGEPFTYYFEASTANVSEEVPEPESPLNSGYFVSSSMNNYYADILYSANLGWLGNFNAGLDSASSDYGRLHSSEQVFVPTSEVKWDRAEQKLALQQKYFDHLTLTYAHSHYINQEGFSPYLFEGYWYSPYDTFTGSIKVTAWWSYLSMKASYELPSWDLFRVNYELLFGMHCYDLIFQYVLKRDIDTMRSEFNFSFELVPSRWI